MKMRTRRSLAWEIVAYVGLALCIFGQIAVGKMYIVAQLAYLVANASAVVRDFAIKLPTANKVKDCVFFGITAGLIAIWIWG